MEQEGENKKKMKVSYRDIFRFIIFNTKDRRFFLALSFVLVITAVVLSSMTPIYIGQIVDFMIEPASEGFSKWDEILKAFGILIALRVGNEIFLNSGSLSMHHANTYIMRRMGADAIYKVQRFSTHWHEDAFSGGTVRKISRGMWAVFDFTYMIIMTAMPACVMIVAIEIMLAFKMPTLSLTLAGIFVFYIFISTFISAKLLRPRFKAFIKEDTNLSAALNDVVAGIHTVKSFGAEKREDINLGKNLSRLKQKTFSAFRMNSAMNALRHLMDISVYAVGVSMAIFMWKEGKASPGDIVLVISAVSLVTSYLQNIGMCIAQVQRALSDMDDIVHIWLRDDEVRDIDQAKELVISESPSDDFISFDKVSFSYPNVEEPLFKDLSVQIPFGEKLALVGTSGSGKSSFVKLLQRLYNLNSGKIYINGQDISKVTMESLRQSISLVPQDPILFHRSLRDNITYGKPNATMDEIIAASKKAYAHDFISALDKGYETLVGERGVKLSGGERQRVAIARAILADKPILVLDEATSSLDSVSEFYIKKAMEELMKDKTTVTIAHRLSTIQKSDRVLVFDKGEIIEQGSHDELMSAAHSRYKELYNTQSLGIVLKDDEGADEAA